MPFELSWIPGGSVGFLSDLFGFFELTMVVVRGRVVLFFSDYLIGRSTQYSWSSFLSGACDADVGVGQGSALSPILFFFFLNHQFVTRCSIAVRGRLSTTSSLQFWPQETKTPLIGRKTQLESIEIKEKSK